MEEKIKNYIKEHLTISVKERFDAYSPDTEFEISLKLDDEIISQDTVSIPTHWS